MDKMTKQFKTYLPVISLLLAGFVFWQGQHQRSMVGQMGKVSLIQGGVQTCFYRAYQSFTAHLLGLQDSNYLTKRFTKNTESCFSDVVDETRTHFKSALKSTLVDMNELASHVHWLHNTLEGKENKLAKGSKELSLNKRFEKIEAGKESILGSLSEYNQATETSLKDLGEKIKWLMIALGVSLFGSLFYLQRLFTFSRKADKAAAMELNHPDFPRHRSIQDLLSQIFNFHKLRTVESLHQTYSEDINALMEGPAKVQASETKVEPTAIQIEELPDIKLPHSGSKASVIQERVSKKTKEEPSIQIDRLVAHVVSLVSNDLFKEGIVLDLQIPSDIKIYGNPNDETIIHLFYNLFKLAIRDMSKGNSSNKVLNFSVESGQDLVRIMVKLPWHENSRKLSQEADFEILSTLLSEGKGNILLDSESKHKDGTRASLLDISLPLQTTPTKASVRRIQSLVRGTKKQVREALREF